MENNTFLRNFIKMRETLKESGTKKVQDIKSLSKPTKEMDIDELIKDKPAPKIVEDYFKKRIGVLFQD